MGNYSHSNSYLFLKIEKLVDGTLENLLIQQGRKSVSLFGPIHFWNLLKITTLLVYLATIIYLALLVYLAPESSHLIK